MNNKLLVIIPDRLSDLVNKGEVIPRYYNPGNLFGEVHILMTNDDKPDHDLVQPMVGNAKLKLHNLLPEPHFFRKTFGWQFNKMRPWVSNAMKVIEKINPALIRTHNNFLEGYLAVTAKKTLGIPFVTSLHGAWDADDLSTFKQKIHRLFRKKLEIKTLTHADAVICVYSTIEPYAKSHGATHPHLIHNFVGNDFIAPKTNWENKQPIKIITVNRQMSHKNPENIIRSLKLIPFDIRYTLIGDGHLNSHLKNLSKELGLENKVTFISSLPNDKVCKLYQQSDFMVSNCHYKGISKTLIEAALTGLPIVINKYRDGYKLKEYQGDWLMQCEDTPEEYAHAIQTLIQDQAYRKALGEKANQIAQQNFSPKSLENRVVKLYQELRLQ